MVHRLDFDLGFVDWQRRWLAAVPGTIAQIPLVASRHVTTRQARRVVRVVTRRVLCVLRRACCNMADHEEAVGLVLACKTISCFIIIYYFSSQVKLIR